MGTSGSQMGGSTTAEEAAVDMDLTGKVCIVTGANTGIGKETARVLAKHNGTVILGCRSLERGNEAKKEIIENLKQSKSDFNENLLKVMELDLSSLESTKQFAVNFTKEYNQLHYLINNAGVMALQEWQASKDGYEMQFATNHLGHFYLTSLLTNVLMQSKPSRVINVSSEAHQFCPNPFVDNLKSYIEKKDGPAQDNYGPWANYGVSKASNILFAREYNRRYQPLGITSVSLHPGTIPTDLSRNLPNWMASTLKSSFGRLFLKTIPQGAATSVRCVSLKDSEIQGGHYYKDCNEADRQLHQQFRADNYNQLKDDQVANDQAYLLWQLSEKLITQKNFSFDLNNNKVEQKSNVEVSSNATSGNNTSSQVIEEVQK